MAEVFIHQSAKAGLVHARIATIQPSDSALNTQSHAAESRALGWDRATVRFSHQYARQCYPE